MRLWGCGWVSIYCSKRCGGVSVSMGNRSVLMILRRAMKKIMAVNRQPNPYDMLLGRLIDEASQKYFVGQLISATVYPNHTT